jgi:hypothetical protein
MFIPVCAAVSIVDSQVCAFAVTARIDTPIITAHLATWQTEAIR